MFMNTVLCSSLEHSLKHLKFSVLCVHYFTFIFTTFLKMTFMSVLMYSPNQSLKKVSQKLVSRFSMKCAVEWLRIAGGAFANTFVVFHSIQAKASNWINANVYWITDDIMLFRYLLFMVFILLHENKFYILWGYSMHCTLMSFVGWPEDFWLLAWKHQIN